MFKALVLMASIAVSTWSLGPSLGPPESPAQSPTEQPADSGRPSNYDRSSPYYSGELIGALQEAPRGKEEKKVSVLTGQITDEQGKPVAGVKVKLWSGIATRFAGQSTLTDSTGTYRFEPLETGARSTDGLYTGIQIEHPQLVSADGENWWDVIVPFGQSLTKNFTVVRGGQIAGSLTFGSGQWTLNEFPLRFASTEQPHAKRVAYVTTGGGPGEFISPVLFPGEYDVTWNSAYPQKDTIIRVKVEPGKTTRFKANLIFEMKAECTETPAVK